MFPRFFVVPVAGLEPAHHCWLGILSPPRLPIPTHRLTVLYYYIIYAAKNQVVAQIFIKLSKFGKSSLHVRGFVL